MVELLLNGNYGEMMLIIYRACLGLYRGCLKATLSEHRGA
jgi:hypothetical protein